MSVHRKQQVARAVVLLLIVAALAHILFQHLHEHPSTPPEKTWSVMGTLASVRVPEHAREQLPDIQALVAARFSAVNEHTSVYLPESDISRLNASTSPIPLAPLTETLLKRSARMTRRTDGLFDPTLLPLIQLWGFSGGSTPTAVPPPEAIAAAQRRMGHDHIIVDNGSAWRNHPDVTYDSGGIAKGFAVDLAYDAITHHYPQTSVLINLGGEIRVHGQATPDRPWRIGVQHPFEPGQTVGILSLESGQAVATSGHYERFFVLDGIRYAHIIDPTTGYPATGTAGVTVLCQNATEADVLSTAAFVGGIEKATALLSRFPDAHILIIPDAKPLQIYLSDKMRSRFAPAPPFRNSLHPFPNATVSTPYMKKDARTHTPQ